MSAGLRIGIVGMGPRGFSVLERLAAHAGAWPGAGDVTVHVIDPAPAGAGRVWQTHQSSHLLMNTVAAQITVFTDASVSCAGPLEPGPNLYEWAQRLEAESNRYEAPDQALAEARALRPGSYPTRSLYGHYLRWAFRRTVAGAPRHMAVKTCQDTAVGLEERDRHQVLTLAAGGSLVLDAVVLAQGHLPAAAAPQAAAAAGKARYIAPGNPAEAAALQAISPGEPVALRGLGLNFFDHLALLTQGRGGTFAEGPDGRLKYQASGREPRLYAGSRRGVPHQARGENQKGVGERDQPLLLTPSVINRLRRRAASHHDVQFRRDVWPLIAGEVEVVYYRTLLNRRGAPQQAIESFVRSYLVTHPGWRRERLLQFHGIAGDDRWSWGELEVPYGGEALSGRSEFRSWLVGYLDRDAALARGGNVDNPLKAALDALRDLRNEIRQVVDRSGITGDSYRDELAGWYSPFNARLSIGPPGRRIAEMAALIRSGVLEPVGPGMVAVPVENPDGFLISSGAIPSTQARVTTLIEARMPEPDVRTTSDALVRQLLATGQAASYRIPNPDGSYYETGALAVSGRPARLIDAHGHAHPRRFALGVPTEGVHWATAAGVRPGVDSVTLSDADAIAGALLEGVRGNSRQLEGIAS